MIATKTVQQPAKLGGNSSRMEKKVLRSTIVATRVLQGRIVSDKIKINRFHVSLVVEKHPTEDEEGTKDKFDKVRKENGRETEEHFPKVKEGKEFRLRKLQVCSVVAVTEVEEKKKLDRRSEHHQLTTNGEKSHLPAQDSATKLCPIRCLPTAQRRRVVSWWDGYSPDSSDSFEGISAGESDMSSTSTVRVGSHLAKVLAAQVASWAGGRLPLTH